MAASRTAHRAGTRRRHREPIAAAVARLLTVVASGALRERPFALRFWDGSELPATRPGLTATIVVRDSRALAHVLREPNQLGIGRAWVCGALDLEGDLERTLALRHDLSHVSASHVDRARAAITAAHIAGSTVLRRPATVESEAKLTGSRRSRRRDRAAVRHHYDVPVDFYRLILGPSMVYSCAYFADPDETLERAQERKLELICRKLSLRAGERLLDVGCGWGSLIIHAAARHGVRAVGVTLSQAQAEQARERIRDAGVADRCDVHVADYRDLVDGPYDAIASVGMYEHVGRDQLTRYGQVVARLLRPGGRFLNHGIARLTPAANDDRTFIRRFVFPDGELHPVGDLLDALRDARLEIRDVESLREHYGLTLRRWADNLNRHRDAAIHAADVEHERIWRVYMTGCAAAFEHAELSVFQTLAVKAGAPHHLPLTRHHLTHGPHRPSPTSAARRPNATQRASRPVLDEHQ